MKRTQLKHLLIPFFILLAMLAILFLQNRGIRYASLAKDEMLLDAGTYDALVQKAKLSAAQTPYKTPPILLLKNGTEAASIEAIDNTVFVLERMKLDYRIADLSAEDSYTLDGCESVIVTFSTWDLLGSSLFTLCDWVNDGGQLLFAAPPGWCNELMVIAPKLGVINSSFEYDTYQGVHFITDFMPLMQGKRLTSSFFGSVNIPMRLLDDEKTICHVVTNDTEVPLLWERRYGNGRFVVNNNPLFGSQLNHGYIASVVSLLGDSCAYAVINGASVFIDDFPAPVVQGYDKRIYAQYGASISEFYDTVWWPDMYDFALKYGLRYTGLLVETYNNKVMPPFDAEGGLNAYIKKGRELFSVNGEIGYHGYNHQSLVLSDFDYEGELDYRKYSSTEDIALALKELQRFADELFPGYHYTVYVPPSNVLSDEARKVIAESFPEVRVISGITESEESPVYYTQDFDVGSDGIVNVPRVSSGALQNEFTDWSIYNELAFRLVFSHFIHPDDVLDEERGALLGWATLRNKLDGYFTEVDSLHVRDLTASDLGGAVQRYSSISLDREDTGKRITIYCHGLLDEAWILLRIRDRVPADVVGGELTPLATELYLLQAKDDIVTIDF